MTNEEKQIEEMGMSGYSKLAWTLWDKTKLPMTQCEVIEQILKEQGYRKASDVAREIFAEIEKIIEVDKFGEAKFDVRELYKIEKKYESEGGE